MTLSLLNIFEIISLHGKQSNISSRDQFTVDFSTYEVNRGVLSTCKIDEYYMVADCSVCETSLEYIVAYRGRRSIL